MKIRGEQDALPRASRIRSNSRCRPSLKTLLKQEIIEDRDCYGDVRANHT